MHVKRFVELDIFTTTYDNVRSIRFFAIKRELVQKENIDSFLSMFLLNILLVSKLLA